MNFLKNVIQKYFEKRSVERFLEGNSCVRIIDTIESVEYFDGVCTHLNCPVKNDYYFGNSDAVVFMKSYISFVSKQGENITIPIFLSNDGCYCKSLSDWNPPNSGFFKEDVLELISYFGFKVDDERIDTIYAKFGYYDLKLNIKIASEKIFILIHTITGGRAPEGMYLVGVYEVLVTNKFRERYLTKNG